MTAKNEITGDKIKSKIPSKEYLDNFDKVFGKPKKIVTKADWSEVPKPGILEKDWDYEEYRYTFDKIFRKPENSTEEDEDLIPIYDGGSGD